MSGTITTLNAAKGQVSDTSETVLACAHGHFGELLQGLFVTSDRKGVRGLVSLPTSQFVSKCYLKVYPGTGRIIMPQAKGKALAAVQRYFEVNNISLDDVDIGICFTGNIPEGLGLGSSTADIIAVLKALDALFVRKTSELRMAEIAVFSELASDPTMLANSAVLFAQRDAFVIEDFKAPFPPLEVLGVNLLPGKTFETIENPPPEYTSCEVEAFAALRGQLRTALRAGDVCGIGRVSTKSAEINQRYYPKPHFDLLLSVSHATQGCGVVVSHSGTMAGILYPSDADGVVERTFLARCLLNRAGLFQTVSVAVGDNERRSDLGPGYWLDAGAI